MVTALDDRTFESNIEVSVEGDTHIYPGPVKIVQQGNFLLLLSVGRLLAMYNDEKIDYIRLEPRNHNNEPS